VWFEVAGKGYAVHAWGSASGVTWRMRKMMHKVNERAADVVVPEETIEKLSSKSCRIAMMTLLTRAEVPMPEVVENGGWEDEAMARTYLRTYDALAVARRNLTNAVFLPAAGAGEASSVAGAGVGQAEGASAGGHTLGSIQTPPWFSEAAVPRSAAELVSAVLEQDGGALALPGVVTARAAGEVAASSAAPSKKSKERSEYRPCCPALWVKGKVFKSTNVVGDSRLRELLDETADERPAKVQKVLCVAQYHVTRKEIMNYRDRLAFQGEILVAPEVSGSELMLAIREDVQGA